MNSYLGAHAPGQKGKNSGALSSGDCLGLRRVSLAPTGNRTTHPGRVVCSVATALTALPWLDIKVALYEANFLDQVSDHGLLKRLLEGVV